MKISRKRKHLYLLKTVKFKIIKNEFLKINKNLKNNRHRG